jgi:predicted lipid-binding transport protein (Tim44 family)
VVSVRFNGRIKEDESAPAVEFTEVWHLTKPASGNQGWVVAGIQQLD